MSTDLTAGAVYKLHTCTSQQVAGYTPVVQVVAIKSVVAKTEASLERNKLIVSDGVHFASTIAVSPEMNQMIANGDLIKNSIVRLDKITTTKHTGNNVIILYNATVICQTADRIGTPKSVNEAPAPPQVSSSDTALNSTNSVGGMTGSAGIPGNIYPIASLNPYQNKWTIKARVLKKSDVRTWNNARGEGKLFSMDLMDESGEIRCTGFTEMVDRFFSIIEQDKVYYFSRCQLKTANKQFTAIKNDYEMTMTNDTTIVPCADTTSVPQVKLNYTPIVDLENITNNSFVDIIGIATEISDVQNLTARTTGKQLTKRDIKIMDRSGAAVSLTLWGNDAQNFNMTTQNPVISVKAAKVSDFGGRSLSVSFNSTLHINPDSTAAYELRGWYDEQGKDMAVKQMSNSQGGSGSMETPFKTFAEIKTMDIQEKPEYFSNTATIVFVKKDNCMYIACPSADCNKKVIQESGSEYRCEKCDKSYPNFKYRLMLTMKLSDFSGQEWVTCFQESGEKLLGITADELGALKENNEQEFDGAINKLNFTTHTFKVRGRIERYMDETRLKCTTIAVDQVDYMEDIKRSLAEIRRLEAME